MTLPSTGLVLQGQIAHENLAGARKWPPGRFFFWVIGQSLSLFAYVYIYIYTHFFSLSLSRVMVHAPLLYKTVGEQLR